MERYLLGLYEKAMPNNLSLKEKLLETQEAGFDFMELSIDETDEKLARLHWSETELREAHGAQEAVGIPIKTICLSGHRRFPLGHPDPVIQRASLEIMRDAIRISAKLGVRLIQIAGYDVFYEPSSETTRGIFAKNLALAAEMGAL